MLLRFLMKQCGGASGLVSIPILSTIPIAYDYIYCKCNNVFVRLLSQLLTITITTCLQRNFQPGCSYLHSYFAHGTPQPRTCRGFAKNCPSSFFLNCTLDNVHGSRLDVLSLEKLDLARNWVSLVVKFDQQGCHHKWNRWISSISWPAQEIESRESTVGSSVGWRCKAGTEARWPRHLDWQDFV